MPRGSHAPRMDLPPIRMVQMTGVAHNRAEESRTGRVVAPFPPTVGTGKMGRNPA